MAAASSNDKFRYINFLPKIRWLKRLDGVLPYRYRPTRRLTYIKPTDMVACQLVVASSNPVETIEIRGPIALSIFIFSRRSIRHLKGRLNVLAHAFRPFASPLQRPPSRRHHRLVGCCVSLSNDGHPRPVLRPSLNFSKGAISAPQTKASNAARASPAAGRH